MKRGKTFSLILTRVLSHQILLSTHNHKFKKKVVFRMNQSLNKWEYQLEILMKKVSKKNSIKQ